MAYKVLGNIEAVRTRPGMYVGDLSTPDHLATELLDNALDEIVNGFATKVDLFYNQQDNSFWCSDNGRGLEVGFVELPDGTQEDSVKTLCTYLHSGSKFDNVDYDQLIGMHGVGLVVTNALSDWMVIKTRDRIEKTKIYIYTFKDSDLVSRTEEFDDNLTWSTVVGFKPTDHYFEKVEFDNKSFIERLIFVQSIYNLDKFTFNNTEIPKLEFESYVKQLIGLEEDEQVYELIHKNSEQKSDIKIILTYLEEDNYNIVGNANLKFCDGKFLTAIQTELKKSITEKIDKKFDKIADREFLNGLRMFVLVNVPEPKFDAQIKNRMILDIKDSLIEPLKGQINWFVGQVINTIETNLENKLHQKITSGVKTTRGTKRISAANKLKDCLKTPGEILYILEGDSAGGTLNQARDKNLEAYFPLKGKVLNVLNASFEKIQNNKEIKYLIEALGPVSSRRYKYIKILPDADEDGKHIAVLSLLVLQKYAPDMIKGDRVSVIIPPLFGAEKGGRYVPIYNKARISEFEKNGYLITRFKGLGEMNPDQLKSCIRSGFEHKVKWPKTDKDLESLKLLISDSDVKRNIMSNPSIKMDVIMNEIIENLKSKIN